MSHPIMEKVPISRVPISRLQKDMECDSLIDELQIIWNEVGESVAEKNEMLLELEQECLEIYRRKVDQANRCRAQLRQAIADSEAEIATICSAMGERPVHLRQNDRSLKEEFKVIIKQLEEMRERKSERLTLFLEIVKLIQCISAEISPEHGPFELVVDESDLSLRRLEDLQKQLDFLQKEKSDRLQKVLEYLNSLNSFCLVLGIDFKQTATEVHPSLIGPHESKSVCNNTIEKLKSIMQRLREIKLQRMHKLQDLASSILEMWHLMDTPVEEQQKLQNITRNIAASEHEITEPNAVSMEFIRYVEAEVLRLEELKASKMKDLILRKKIEVDELRRHTHLIQETDDSTESAIEAIKSAGSVDLSLILEQFEVQLSIVKEEAFSRKEILERVEKWLDACQEESWLEEYNRDENRYNIGKGTHLMLKHAEKARVVVAKIPGIVETLTSKVIAWENERGAEFIYDGSSLLSMLEEYTMLRQEKEQERKRQRDQRKLQGQLIAEQETMFGSKPSPSKPQSGKKLTRSSTGTKRQSAGCTTSLQPQKPDQLPSVKCSSAKKPDALSGDAWEGETPRKPFRPLGQSHSVLSSSPHTGSFDAAEEENKTPMTAPISGQKNTPNSVSTPMQMNTAAHLQQEAALKMAAQEELSFEERRLALLLKG